MSDISGKIAVITGGSTGIGLATVELFARSGATVVIGDINDEGGEAASAMIKSLGSEGFFQHTDVSEAEQVRLLMESAIDRFGRIDILFNNAAALGADVFSRKVLALEVGRYGIRVNAVAPGFIETPLCCP